LTCPLFVSLKSPLPPLRKGEYCEIPLNPPFSKGEKFGVPLFGKGGNKEQYLFAKKGKNKKGDRLVIKQ